MEGKKTKPRALLVFGAPCSGKTTFSEKFAEKFRLTFFDLDKIKVTNNFSRKNILTILELIAKTRQNLVLEGGLDTEKQREEIVKILRLAGYEPSLVWIQTDLSTIRARLKAKHKSVSEAKELYDKATSVMEAPSEVEFPIILSGKHTFETQSRHVISALAEL